MRKILITGGMACSVDFSPEPMCRMSVSWKVSGARSEKEIERSRQCLHDRIVEPVRDKALCVYPYWIHLAWDEGYTDAIWEGTASNRGSMRQGPRGILTK